MDNKKNHSAINWQQAVLFFENNLHLEIKQIKHNAQFITFDEDIKAKIITLYTNKRQSHTILDQADIYLRNNVLNQDLSGQTIDSYQLIELIAHGGMSSVYRARKTETQTQKDVAIKLIPTNLQTENTITLFKQELKTLAKLHHPNIISLHHGDVSKSGTPYLVMELVENALQIDVFFKQQKSDVLSIIEQFITLCHVIHYAHQNGIIHQDIKPSNVLMDEHGHLLVLDFGVAALADAIPDHHAYTLNYATPEQAVGKSLALPSFDTFAITSLLVKCLSQADDHQSGWQKSAINQLNINRDLRIILNKGTEERGPFRYQQAEELAVDLNLWKNKLPISHLKHQPFYRLNKTISRHPTTTVLAAFILISMTLGIVFYQQQYRIALSESVKAQQVKNILIEAIEQNDPDISKGQKLTVRDMLKKVELSHAENTTTDNNTAKELYLTLSQAFNKLGDYESTEKNIQHVLTIEPENTQALLELAELKIQQKQLTKAKELLSTLSQSSSDFVIEDIIRIHLLRADLAVINNDFGVAENQFAKAQQLAEQTDSPKIKTKVFAAHANGLLEQDKVNQAIAEISKAVSLSELTLGNQNSKTLELKAKLAETYLSFNGEKVEQATEIFNKIIPQQQKLLGDDHPIVAKSLFLNATALRSLNQLPEARKHAEQALIIVQKQFGHQHLLTGKILMALGGIYLAEGDFKQAIEYAKMAVKNHEEQLGQEHPETLQYKTSYVAMLVKNNQHQDALDLLLQIHPIQTAKLGSDHRGTLYVEIVLSKTYAALGQLAKSVATGERCLNNAKKSSTKNIMEVYCALTLENAYFLNQNYQAALSLIKQYQDDPLIASQPPATQQFEEHLLFIDKQPLLP